MRITLILTLIGWLAAGGAAITVWQAMPREITWSEQQQIKATRPGAQALDPLPTRGPVNDALMREALLLLIAAGLLWGIGQIALSLQQIEATTRAARDATGRAAGTGVGG